jgi:hypothetical protein
MNRPAVVHQCARQILSLADQEGYSKPQKKSAIHAATRSAAFAFAAAWSKDPQKMLGYLEVELIKAAKAHNGKEISQ